MAISAGMALMSTAVAGFTGATLIGGSLMTHFLVTTAMGAVLNALTPKPSFSTGGSNAANLGYQVSTRGAAQNHQIIYGQTKVGGAIVFDAVSGESNKVLHRVIAFAGHEVEAFSTVYFNDETLTLTTDTDSNGDTYYKPTLATDAAGDTSDRYNDFVRIYQRKGGAENDTAITALISAGVNWTEDHKLQGVAYLYLRLEFDADAFPNGVPEMTALVKGKKVYDPRTATASWSDNPAICVRDYLTNATYGLGEIAGSLDDGLIEIAANVCQHYNYPTLTGDARFTLNGSFTTSVTPASHIVEMLGSMGGLLWYGQGKWRMRAAHYVAPTVSFDEDDLRSDVSVSTRHSRRDNFNTVKGVFRGAESDYQPTDYAQVTNEAFRTADNGQISTYDLDLPFTDNFAMCRRLALITLERNRQQLTVQATFGMSAFQVQVGDIIRFTMTRMGWAAKEFEVIQWSFGLQGDSDLQVDLVLREISESVFDDISDGVVYERDNTNLLSPFDVPSVGITPSALTKIITEKIVTELSASITASDVNRIDRVEVQYKLSSDSEYLPMGTGELGRYSVLDLVRGQYDIRARGINTFGVKGAWVYETQFQLDPPDDEPEDVIGLDVEISTGTCFLNWLPVSDLDLSYYQVRHTAAFTGDANELWATSNTVIQKVARPATFATVPARSGTFLIKAIDKVGQYSINATKRVILASDLPTLGVQILQTETASFVGNNDVPNVNTVIDTSANPDELIIDDTSAAAPTGIYYFGGALSGSQTQASADYIDLGTSRSAVCAGSVTFNRHIDYASVFDNIPQNWDTWPNTFDEWADEDANFGDMQAVTYVQATSDDPASASPTYGPWLLANGQQVVGRGFRFRVVMSATNTGVSPSIATLTGTVGY